MAIHARGTSRSEFASELRQTFRRGGRPRSTLRPPLPSEAPPPIGRGFFACGKGSIPGGSALPVFAALGFALAMDLHFDCTQCGRCCHDLRLTLSIDEARAWAGRGHQVDLLAEGWPWPDNGDPHDAPLQWRKATSFPVLVGDVPFRINLRLVARHVGPCPHLLPDMRCGNYEERPRICRIYPLESRPFEAVSPALRKCPPEAWQETLPLLERDGRPADAEANALLAAHRQAMIDDVPLKARLASALGFADTAFAGEGLAVCEIAPLALLTALEEAACELWDEPRQWTIVTNRQSTAQMLDDLDCPARLVSAGPAFLPAFADES